MTFWERSAAVFGICPRSGMAVVQATKEHYVAGEDQGTPNHAARSSPESQPVTVL